MMQDEPRLRTGIWVQAQIRRCDAAMIPIAVRHRGDATAGSVLLLVDGFDRGVRLYVRATDAAGRRGWLLAATTLPARATAGGATAGGATAGGAMTEAAMAAGGGPPDNPVDAYIARARRHDPDLWVLEIEDPAGRYELDGPVLAAS